MVAKPKCYILYPVRDNDAQLQELLYWSTFDTVDTNKFYNIDVIVNGTFGSGTYYVVLNPDPTTCPDPIDEGTIIGEPTAVTSYCYYVTSGAITYVDTNDELVSAAGPANICTKIIPQVSTSGGTTPAIVFNGECIEGQPCISQPSCYLLTSCTDPLNVIQSKSSALETLWAQNKIVSLVGQEGCWSIDKAESIEDCDCAISVIVDKTYNECIDCVPVIAYRATNCETGDVKFSEQDLSQYVGKTITDSECGGCWSIEQINIKPPTSETINVVDTFSTCEICLRDYWILTDCEGSVAPIITYTNMTDYVGKIINLVNNSVCWQVEPHQLITGQESVEVKINAEFETCIACKPKAEVQCIRVTNDSEVAKTYQYYIYDNTGEIIEPEFTLEPNETSDKFCSAGWVSPINPATDIVIQYGPCINIYEQPVSSGPTLFNDNPWVCPVQRIGRLVEPGYTVPACTPDKYESISCKAAEILYHRVLSERYGISNCCPEEDEIYLIRKELIDLAALRDKSIECTISTDCCSNPYCN
jgi:hypothetical protein